MDKITYIDIVLPFIYTSIMENPTQLLIILAIVVLAILVLMLWFRTKPKKATNGIDDTDEIRKDKLTLDVVSPFQFNGIEENISERIRNAVNKMGAVGDDAEKNYQAALDSIKPNAQKIIEAIRKELEVIPTDRYLDKWSLIQLLAELRDPASLPLLDKILSKPLPKELYKDPHKRSSLRQETINLTTAVEAITRIASKENKDALQLLFKHAKHESLSVRRASIQGVIEYGDQNAREKLKEILSKNDYYLLDIKKTNIEKVPQISIKDGDIPKRFTPKVNDKPRVTPRRD